MTWTGEHQNHFFSPMQNTQDKHGLHSLSCSLITNSTKEEVQRVSVTANGKRSTLQEKGKETSFWYIANF